MKPQAKILVVDDEGSITDAMHAILADQGYSVEQAATLEKSRALLDYHPYDLVFTDHFLPDGNGVNLLNMIKSSVPRTQVILMTAHGSIDLAIEAIKKGAYYYIEKPFMPDQIITLAERALQQTKGSEPADTATASPCTYGMIGSSPKMLVIYSTIEATADSEASVLIEGRSGTGKELIATAFHASSRRRDKPFVHINCAAIPGELIESELFGYKKGAFTGADRDKRGLIEAALGGTILLDEITEMPMHLQAKLLRVLQERKLRRLGDEREVDVDFRLISATNRDTSQAMSAGLLREDLYFRIGTIKVNVPTLGERLDDIRPLAEYFLSRYSSKYKKEIRMISDPAIAALSIYDWPGNVRELESVIERAVLFSRGDVLLPSDLPEHLQNPTAKKQKYEVPPFLTLEEIEREAIAQTLQRTIGNVKKAAQILQVHRPTFYRKLKKFGLISTRTH